MTGEGPSPILAAAAPRWLPSVLAALRREYPNAPRHLMRDPTDLPRPSELHPAFYGCLDWHSAVEMHWAASRLARIGGGADDLERVAVLFDEHLTEANLRVEAAYLDVDPSFERPYGWGWLLQLAAELDDLPEGRWAAAVRPLAERVSRGFVAWLPRQRLPNRQGTHANTAFALRRAWSWAGRAADAGDPALRDAIVEAAERWYLGDADYPAAWEPSGNDFLSPALAEAELMRLVLSPGRFAEWLPRFLPGLVAGDLPPGFAPQRDVDDSDGQQAHLIGLNLHRAGVLGSLAPLTRDAAALERARRDHLDAALPQVIGGHWMAEHWLAAFAVLALDDPDA